MHCIFIPHIAAQNLPIDFVACSPSRSTLPLSPFFLLCSASLNFSCLSFNEFKLNVKFNYNSISSNETCKEFSSFSNRNGQTLKFSFKYLLAYNVFNSCSTLLYNSSSKLNFSYRKAWNVFRFLILFMGVEEKKPWKARNS